jgi:hypothetical protein
MWWRLYDFFSREKDNYVTKMETTMVDRELLCSTISTTAVASP